jgi:hypothetical protein
MTTTPFGPCKGLRKDGQACGGWAISERGFCVSHDAASAGILAAARRAGGRARHGRKVGTTGDTPAVNLVTLADVLALLQRAVNDCLALENSLSRARTLGYLAGIWGDVFESSELERRVLALEAAQHAGI